MHTRSPAIRPKYPVSKKSFQGEGIKEDQKHYKKTYQAVQDDFLLTDILEEVEISEHEKEPEETLSDEEEEGFTSSMPSSGQIPRKTDRAQVESDPDSSNESNGSSSSSKDDNNEGKSPPLTLVQIPTTEKASASIRPISSPCYKWEQQLARPISLHMKQDSIRNSSLDHDSISGQERR